MRQRTTSTNRASGGFVVHIPQLSHPHTPPLHCDYGVTARGMPHGVQRLHGPQQHHPHPQPHLRCPFLRGTRVSRAPPLLSWGQVRGTPTHLSPVEWCGAPQRRASADAGQHLTKGHVDGLWGRPAGSGYQGRRETGGVWCGGCVAGPARGQLLFWAVGYGRRAVGRSTAPSLMSCASL